MTHIRACYQASRGRYGSPRIHQDLQAQGFRVGRHRVARLMRLHDIRSVSRRRIWRARAGAPPEVAAANILRREFAATRPNEKWAGDITYVPTRQGWLYVAVLMDLYSRRIVGWAMDAQLTTTLTLSRLGDGPSAPACLRWAPASFRSGQPVCGNSPISNGWRPRHPVLDEPSRQLLGQCRGRELLRHAQNGIVLHGRQYLTRRASANGDRCISWRDFIIGPAAIPRWATSALWSSNSGPLTQPTVSCESGEDHLGWNRPE